MLCIVLFIIFTILFFVIKNNFNYWKNRNVPFVKPIPIFGNIFSLLIGKLQASEFIQKLHRSVNAPYLGLFVFHRPFLLIRDLNIIKYILLKDFDYFINKTLRTSKHDRIGLKMFILLKDQSWKMARKSVSSVFTPKKLKSMFLLINEVGDDLIRHIANVTEKKSNNCRNVSIKYGIDVVSSCLFGLKINSLEGENSEFFRMTLKFFEITFSRGIQILSCFFVPQIIDFFDMTFIDKQSMSYMERIFLKMLKERKLDSVKRNDVIDILNEVSEIDSNCKFEEENLTSLAIAFLSAGYETTGSSLSFVWYELSCNQIVQERLRKEVLNKLKNHGEFSYKTILKMEYLDMVINETLRKYPVLGFVDRLCVKDYKVPNTDLVIEKGTGIYISSMALHYDEEYFPNPEKFDPERFATHNKTFPEFAYMPFGKGFRACLGARFALLSLKVATAKTVINFQLDVCEDTPRPICFDPLGLLLVPTNGKLNIKFNRIQHE